MSSNLLTVTGLSRVYDGFCALKDLEFELNSGEVKGIMGPNGAGKSTFLKLLSGEIRASGGTIEFRGRDVTRLPPEKVSRLGISYLSQRPSYFPSLTVKENLRGAVQIARNEIGQGVEKLLDLVDLADKSDLRASSLPYGEKRLLDLAMSLGPKPCLLLADEPTAGIDEDAGREIVDLLQGLIGSLSGGEYGLEGLIFVEHDQGVLNELADKIGFLRSGELILEAPPGEIGENELVEEYLAGKGTAGGG